MKKLFNQRSIMLIVVTLVSITAFASYMLTNSYKTFLIDMGTCINCGECYQEYPDIFKFNEDYQKASWVNSTGIQEEWETDYIVFSEPFPAATISDIEEAIYLCPVFAIIDGGGSF